MSRPEQVLFAFTPARDTPDKVPVLVFVIPEAGWTYMQNGLGHDFDLSAIGIPLKVVIGRTADHDSGMRELRQAGAVGPNTKDVRDSDLSFKPRTKQ